MTKEEMISNIRNSNYSEDVMSKSILESIE